MGCGPSRDVDPEQRAQNDRIGDELMQAREKSSKIHKLLLLGPGNSGKSTFYKQLSSLHGTESPESYDEFKHMTKQAVHDSILDQLKNLIVMAEMDFDLDFEQDEKFSEEMALAIDQAKKYEGREKPLTITEGAWISTIWSNEEVKLVFENRCNLGVVDSLEYFLDEIERIVQADYIPTEKDILLVRIPTTGIRSKKFQVGGASFELFDVGGQKSERNKWIHCFDSVHAVLYVVSLACYDQNLFEDIEVNALHEGIMLWEEVCNSPYFDPSLTAMIIFYNKKDLFEVKIQEKPITICFKEYEQTGQDPHDYDCCVQYIMAQFMSKVENPGDERPIYPHTTTATDRENVKAVFNDVQHAVVLGALGDHGII